MPPLISVIIPCYRQAHYLPAAVESALAQSHPAIETIVVNDGSDDDTEAVARKYGDRIRYVWKPNGGLSSARNAGIAASTGDYLLFLDADDLLHPESLMYLSNAMEGRHDRIALMGFRHFIEDCPLAEGTDEHLPVATFFLPLLINTNLGPVHAHLCPRKLVQQVGGFEESLRSCEDWDFWIRLAWAGAALVTIPFAGAYYRRYAGSMSTNTSRMLQNRTNVLLRLHDRILNHPEYLQQWGQELYQAEHRVRRRWLANGQAVTMVEVLTQRLQQLQEHGFSLQGSWRSRLVHAFFGLRGDQYAMRCLRHFAPNRVAYYANSYT